MTGDGEDGDGEGRDDEKRSVTVWRRRPDEDTGGRPGLTAGIRP